MKISEFVSFLNQLAPYSYQESYDNSGLLVGDPNAEISGVLVSLDCIESVIDEAISLGCNTIVSHHPIVFKGLKRITGSNYIERTVQKAIKNDINLISIHTNLDNVAHGVNKIICDKLNLKNTKILSPKESGFAKLSIYVPITHADVLRQAISEAGAGKIGDYEACSFSFSGTGRFKPNSNANPYIGKPGELEEVQEEKIDVVVPKHALGNVLSAMKNAHPYEEVAYDLVDLVNTNEYVGSGMVGELENPTDTLAFLQQVKTVFNAGVVRFTNPNKKEVQRISVCGGSGSFLLNAAKKAKADVFITADFKYHEFFDAENQIIIADIGHFESEQYTSHWLVAEMRKKFTNFAVRLTSVNTNPINYL
jgi:dinuclear metal center YbgI/SA1388 family protein